MEDIIEKACLAKKAGIVLSKADTVQKNKCLRHMMDAIAEDTDYILNENQKDMAAGRSKGMSEAMLDRLLLDKKRLKAIIEGLGQLIALKDPVGEVISMNKMPNGLLIGQTRVPLGVIGIIYEARPNVTVDAASLCIKSGNAVILRGGSEAVNSNIALVKSLRKALAASGLPEDSISIIEDTSRETAIRFMKLNEYIDVLIPRGGAGLIKSAVENATIPVIQTGTGNCHVYVDSCGDLDMAEKIVINAKVSRPGVCNAEEKLLVHKDVADEFIPRIVKSLRENGVEVRGCEKTVKLSAEVKPAEDIDWYTEYLDYIIAVKIVDSIDEAIEHINRYGTKHSEAIVTENYSNSRRFLAEVDAAAVYINASTRFTDGFEFGLGAEIGISTQKLHARGPMGLKELTSTKYVIYGNGQVR
ncbi:MAG TPA: glutamate-5-semialdehyde dehydrogenase [Bacillota bacterium]|nr:glutamate-5-semialdehyde dehydrogenase [Bacillota bacterium]HRS20382.1 glutamate-5-semialdehyde dehydrogenase [Clostridia bacterium]HRU40438.1 glutamate-5-semialdehyde dehydrogenase [Candidatus Diapherotrites archaeon]HQE66428.1 glutamate-5-semialdehyde dehydrogenase [Bacillota bacterium]HQI15505.1 glutamate-5-semialdehyde dehydrogenase [Bacillota bacterium]